MALCAPADRLTSTMSSGFVADKLCMPGSAAAIFLNKACSSYRAQPVPGLQSSRRNWGWSYLDVEACLGAGLNEHDIELSCLGVTLLYGDLPAMRWVIMRCSDWLAGQAAQGSSTHLLSTKSVLFPTRTTMTSLPRSVRTSSIQRAVLRNVCRPADRPAQHLKTS